MSEGPKTDLDVAREEAVAAARRWYRLYLERLAQTESLLYVHTANSDGPLLLLATDGRITGPSTTMIHQIVLSDVRRLQEEERS